MEPLRSQQEHYRLQRHARVSPLRWWHIAVQITEQSSGGPKTFPVACADSRTRHLVFVTNTQSAVTTLSEFLQTFPYGRPSDAGYGATSKASPRSPAANRTATRSLSLESRSPPST